jgi:hypothetical protein
VSIDINSPESRKALAKMVTKLFSLWCLEPADQLALLDLNPANEDLLDHLRSGEAELPETGETMERVTWLLTVHKTLRIAYSYNRDLVYRWVTAKNQRFDGKTPLEIMRQGGLAGIKKMAVYLESI